MQGKKKFRTCFIVAPVDVDIRAIRSLLHNRHISAYDTLNTPALGLSISSQIEEKIRKSDFVIAVASSEMPRANVFFELGLAYGADKPIFLIFQDGGPLPTDLKGMTYVRASAKDREKIAFALDQFLTGYEHQSKKSIFTVRRTPRVKIEANSLQKELDRIAVSGTENELESFLARLMKSTSQVFTQYHGVKEKGVDMAIWIDNLESSFGNPILVDIKMGNLSEHILTASEEQLRRYLALAKARSGVLMYLDREGRSFHRSKFEMPLVIRLDIRSLVSQLSVHSFAHILSSERNATVHAGK